MSTKNLHWHKIADHIGKINFSGNGLAEITILGKKYCVAIHQENLYACAQKCPHAGGILAEGYLDALGNIVCPIHRYKFNPVTGRNVSGEGFHLKTYPIENRPDGVFIGISPGFFG